MNETTAIETEKQEKKKPERSFLCNMLMLFLKLLIIGVIIFVMMNYVFGFSRNQSINMQPAVQDGDLLFYFRIVNDYAADDIVIIHYQGKEMPERIVAVAGDTVDIGEDGLLVNGSLVQEEKIYTETYLFENEVTFPVTVPQGQVFVLGDNRPQSADSRIFGCVMTDDIDGKVVGLFRRRNF